jgi:hypothetical protein
MIGSIKKWYRRAPLGREPVFRFGMKEPEGDGGIEIVYVNS